MDQQQARLWLAIALSMVVWLAYDHYILAPARQARENQTEVAKKQPEGMPEPEAMAPPSTQPPQTPEAQVPGEAVGLEEASGLRAPPSGEPITVDTPLYKAILTPRGGRIVSFELKRYRKTVDPESPPLDLVGQEAAAILPLTVWIGSGARDGDIDYHTNQTSFVLHDDEKAELVLQGHDASGRSIAKRISFDASTYLLGVDVAVSGGEVPSSISLVIPKLPDTGGYSRGGDHGVAIADGKLIEHSVSSMEKEPARNPGVEWAGFSGTYFASVGVPVETRATAVFGSIGSDPVIRLDSAASAGAAKFLVLMGPKDREILESYGHSFERLVDFGWFWFLASPMLWLLHRIHDVVGNYGVAIIVITVLLKLITFPLNQTSMKSMRKMQQIQPQLQRLRDRHKDDPSAMQKEMMDLYKKHNVNPFSGCLPMIIQFPVFIALYNGLLRDIALRHAPFIGWINDLSAPDRLHVASVGIPVLTLLMGASMLLQQLTAPAQGDPNQRRMMMIMPVVFTFMFLKFPSGLVLYWLVNNVISIGQQYLTLRTVT